MAKHTLSTSRLAVSLTDDDNKLLIELRTTLESKDNRRHSFADVVRASLRALAKQEGLNGPVP